MSKLKHNAMASLMRLSLVYKATVSQSDGLNFAVVSPNGGVEWFASEYEAIQQAKKLNSGQLRSVHA